MPSSLFEVRVLRCRIPLSAVSRGVLHASITDDEERRRSRFLHADDADRFLLGRGTLRRELGQILGLPPREVPVVLGLHDKPLVVGGTPHINVSHSGHVVLVAHTAGAAIGIDVEHGVDHFAHEAVLDHFFSDREVRDLATLPDSLRVAAFFHTWTSREAIMKAVGWGLNLPRDSFDVSVDPRRPPALLAARTGQITAGALSLISIAVPPGHVAVAAIAAPAGAYTVSISDELPA